MDEFQLQTAVDPQISLDGKKIVYVRRFADPMTDKRYSNLWVINADGTDHRPISSGNHSYTSPRWSPDSTRIAFLSDVDGKPQIYVRWMDTGQTARITNLEQSPDAIAWSPDGRMISFSSLVTGKGPHLADLPAPPSGAKWADPPTAYDRLVYRFNGTGYLKPGYIQVFVVSAEGGAPRQVTNGNFANGGNELGPTRAAWSPDGKFLLVSANRHAESEHEYLDTEIYEFNVADGALRALTNRKGPDANPDVSPNGKWIAYTGFDDRYQGHQTTKLYIMNRDGSGSRVVTRDLDRDVQTPVWSKDASGIYFKFDDRGNSKVAFTTLDGKIQALANDLGGVSPSRPYGGGTFTVAADGRFAYTHTRPDHPCDIATGRKGVGEVKRITRLNDALFTFKELGQTEEIKCESSFDKRPIQCWVTKPPGFDPQKKYPLILEIHGGPFANYGDRFASENQVYAAAGYVVLYLNPRGSTSYGEEFGNLIDRNYPSQDYDDLMSAVDAVIARGYVDKENLFVTGGSGGGVLTAWIVGKTDRFRAAVSVKPVINWYSHVLTADGPGFFYRYWFPGPPWENAEAYLKRSPLSLVGNVKTPTMLLTGEADYRTPISESEQFYEALKIRKVDTALVRIPDASHMMEGRPSYLVSKLVHILKWFEIHRTDTGK